MDLVSHIGRFQCLPLAVKYDLFFDIVSFTKTASHGSIRSGLTWNFDQLYCDTSIILEALEHIFNDTSKYRSLYPSTADGRNYRPLIRGFASYWTDVSIADALVVFLSVCHTTDHVAYFAVATFLPCSYRPHTRQRLAHAFWHR